MATYELRVVTEFAAAHSLRGYPGSCSRLHGHNWKVEIEIRADELDETGMGMDFREIRKIAREVTDRLDHRYLNELEPFTEINPTAENIAAHCFHEIGARIDRPAVSVQAVTVWENDRACVRYTEGEA
ncbi:6-carboxytetrahydropterin synthase QueD [Halofilum ochraceum]|uniref:6-carboxytetrahydropterin synthase QueD n=1 Tax=Halofilum ochraceum TaxID=1611323 RepID=UPI000833F9B9|nr:6-carboxytetrahydropterin synthase QueD [Halofilum ochraceum]